MLYGILRYPHANKRYFESTKTLAANELIIMSKHFGSKVAEIKFIEIGGLELLAFTADALTEREKQILNTMSNCFALFEVLDNQSLLPICDAVKYYFKDDISSILKYKGKTNETFTDMMINIGVFSSEFYNQFDTPLNIFDPMCGKGTTLFQGLIKGYNTFGLDLDKKEISELDTFFKRYLEFHKYKHNTADASIMDKGKKIGTKYTYETSDSIENYKNNNRRILEFALGNTVDANIYYPKKEFAHCIVSDLPYGVQHAGISGTGRTKVEEVVESALNSWTKTLKTGGTIVLSYNTNTLKRYFLEDLFSCGCYQVFNDEIYKNFEHWVEQAVNRDVFVAKKL